MPPWAYCESLSQDRVVIGDSEAHHLINVLRMKVGDRVTLFDGLGCLADAAIQLISRRDVTLVVLQKQTIERPLVRPTITLAVAAPKGDRLKWMVEKLTELGVHRLQFVDCQRSVATPGETRIDKLKASVIAACKQSRRPIQMDLLPIKPLRSVIDEGRNSYKQILLAHPCSNETQLQEQPITGDTMILVGPEGGFTDDEVKYAIDAGVRAVSWPGTILRIETAAMVFGTLALAGCRRQV